MSDFPSSTGSARDTIAETLCATDGNGFLCDCTPTAREAYLIRADAVLAVIPTLAQAVQHTSDCAVHNAPALPVGPCNCGAELAASISRGDAAVRLVSEQDTPSTTAQGAGDRGEVRLGDIVSVKEGTPYFHDWRGMKMKLVSMSIDPEGKLWASLADEKPRHRGFGVYDGETTDFEYDHLERASSLPSTGGGSAA